MRASLQSKHGEQSLGDPLQGHSKHELAVEALHYFAIKFEDKCSGIEPFENAFELIFKLFEPFSVFENTCHLWAQNL